MKVIRIVCGIVLTWGLAGACVGDVEELEPEELVDDKADSVGLDPDRGSFDAGGDGPEDSVHEEEEQWVFRCQGRAKACPFMTPTQCGLSPVCESEGECAGEARDCSVHGGSVACEGVVGCLWNPRNGACVGAPRPCRAFDGQDSCAAQLGCRWDEWCFGVTRPCEYVEIAECDYHAGCHTVYVRLGD
jgi:hypothetical protein